MDYKPSPCTACSYRLPMTWTIRKEMNNMMEAAGWLLEPKTLCPECRRKIWLERNRRKVSAIIADSR